MENNYEAQPINDIAPLPEKPQFLKVLCILSFVACGLMILGCLLGSMVLGLSEETRSEVWGTIVQSQPQLEGIDAGEFFHQVGMVCIYTLIANIFSLIGVILMWRLNKIGFVIYTIAELSTHFFGIKLNTEANGSSSYGGMIFGIVLDLVFIALYAVNLKYMNKKQAA